MAALGAAEESAREARAWLRAMLEYLPAPAALRDRAGRVRYVNRSGARVLGLEADELVGRDATELLPPGSRERVREGDRSLLASGEPVTYDVALPQPDGSTHDFHVLVYPVLDDAATIVGTGAFALDITERRRAEAWAPLAAIVEYTNDAVIGKAIDGRVVSWNPAAERMSGYTAAEAVGRNIAFLMSAGRAREIEAALAELRRGERVVRLETAWSRRDGRDIDVSLTLSPVLNAAGAVVGASTIARDVTAERAMQEELRHLADHDTLTGLANRRAFGSQLAHQLAHQARYGGELALLMIDLDHFKYINDTLGHRLGDQAICRTARALGARLRESDMLARLGGDEFAVLLPETGRAGAELVAEQIIETLGELRIEAGERDLRVGASIGIVVAGQDDEFDDDSLLGAADLAMYRAKDAGRDRYAVYDRLEDGPLGGSVGLNWSHRIRRALRDDLFVLHYQPIVALPGRVAGGYEALLRMADEAGTPVEPDAFLEAAARYGLMPAIDRWVLRRVVTTLAAGGLPDGARVALNVSAPSLSDPGLLDQLEGLLAEHDVAAEPLAFEVSESTAIARPDEAEHFGRRLHRLGCRFGLDDFGEGFGSLVHLKHLPCDYVKIDGEFVCGVNEDHDDRLVVEGLVGLARGLGKRTVAERVGDEQTLEALCGLGVDYAQGFHVGRPAPADALSSGR